MSARDRRSVGLPWPIIVVLLFSPLIVCAVYTRETAGSECSELCAPDRSRLVEDDEHPARLDPWLCMCIDEDGAVREVER